MSTLSSVPPGRCAKRRQRSQWTLAIDGDWLNDAVKGFLSTTGEFDPFMALSHLRVMVARADYLLSMKCLSMRIGAEFSDLDDVRYLLRHLNIERYEDAVDVISRYYPLDRFPQKTLYVLEELLQPPSQ